MRNDNEIKPEERNKIITDPLQDTLTLQISRNADITRVYAEVSKENNSSISITNIEGSNHSISGKFIHIIIPGKNLGEFNHMFINATTSVGEHMLDKTAWRMADVK